MNATGTATAQAQASGPHLIPELDGLPARPAPPPPPPCEQTGPPSGDVLKRLMELRDEFVQITSNGRFCDAASQEWRELPANWRMALLLIAGIGQDVGDLDRLAQRSWRELPPAERDAVRSVARSAKRHLGRVMALAAKV